MRWRMEPNEVLRRRVEQSIEISCKEPVSRLADRKDVRR